MLESKFQKVVFALLCVCVLCVVGMRLNVFKDFEPHVVSHSVKQGETLWSIAEHYQKIDERDKYILAYMEDDMIKMNASRFAKSKMVYVGEEIKVRYYTEVK